jgi:hypothetical protein
MPKATQFDLALIWPRPEPSPCRLPASPHATSPSKVLRNRRLRLYRLIERTEGVIGEIETELYRRGASLTGPLRRPGQASAVQTQRTAAPLPERAARRWAPYARPGDHATVLTGKGMDPLDRALADATVKRMREVLALLRRKGGARLVGLQSARSARWALVEG